MSPDPRPRTALVGWPARSCEQCGREFRPRRPWGRFCCSECRQRWHGRITRPTDGGAGALAERLRGEPPAVLDAALRLLREKRT